MANRPIHAYCATVHMAGHSADPHKSTCALDPHNVQGVYYGLAKDPHIVQHVYYCPDGHSVDPEYNVLTR